MVKKHTKQDKKNRTGARKNNIIFSIIIISITALGLLVAVNLPRLKSKKGQETQERLSPKNETIPPTFVGGKTCTGCHQKEYKLWQGSHHDLAMQVANNNTVLGDFSDTNFTYFGVTSTFYKRDGKFIVRTDGPDGKLKDYEIKYTFGVYPLQQYLIEFPGGRLQALSIAWDTRPKSEGGRHWFHLYPNEEIKHNDILHWTGPNQNWNYMCAECHSTNLKKNYDPKSNSFNTTWSEINVSCEACHGQGSQHIEWAKRKSILKKNGLDQDNGLVINMDERSGIKWNMDHATGAAKRNKPRNSNKEIELCARCHSRRGAIWNEYKYGKPIMDTHLPALLEEGLYYPDGQIQGEVYEYGSFLQSKMYHQGVTCSDCHEPHSLKLRASDNGVCLQCHLAEKFDSPSHHFHKLGSAGASCVGCHMPTTTYMVVDPRNDHSIRVPRPDISLKLGTPNACDKCHTDRTVAWAAKQMDKWYGSKHPVFQDYGDTLLAGRTGAPLAEESLANLAVDASKPSISRATALSELHRYPSPQSVNIIKQGLNDGDPMVREGAVDAMEGVQPGERMQLAFHLLNDPVRAVRIKTARMLASVPKDQLTPEQSATLEREVDEYIAAQMTNAERPEAHLNVGVLYSELGQFDKAEASYMKALELQPSFVQAYVNLADLYRLQGKDEEGEQLLSKALSVAPRDADVHYALGLLLVRQKRVSEAVKALELSAKLNLNNPHYSYVYAVALNTTGKIKEALKVLEETHARYPNDRETLYGLVTFNRNIGNFEAARSYAEKLIELSPNDPTARSLLDSLQDKR
jgi:Flp pilus assembly protein TadD